MYIKVFTSFSGYDSQCLALNRLASTYRDFDKLFTDTEVKDLTLF